MRFVDFRRSVGSVFEVFGAARRAAGAVNAHRRPDAQSLRTLGIDPDSFNKIRLL